jgi:hypothetical protein
MDWPPVLQFIQQRDPAFLSELEGVPDAAVSALAADRGVALPGTYVEFLRRMGVSSNGYAPFGATQDHGFAAIAERLDDADDTPSGRFFFELRRRARRDVVNLGGTPQAGEGRAALQQALALLQRAGFAPVLPRVGRVACLQAGPLSVLAQFKQKHELLTLQLGSDDPRTLKELADELLAGLPGARRPRRPAGPRNLD